MTHSAWWLTCDALAVYRLAKLITADTITEPLREKLRQAALRKDGRTIAADHEQGYAIMDFAAKTKLAWLFELVTCPWCVSIYAATAVVALTKFIPGIWQYPAMGLALSAAAGFLAER
jgi:hypothetical protein